MKNGTTSNPNRVNQPKAGSDASGKHEYAINPPARIPLRQSEVLLKQGEQGKVGEREEFLGVGTVAFYAKHREIGENLGWSDLGIGHEAQPHAFKDGRYKPVDVYLNNETDAVGIELIFEQRLNSDHPKRWLVNQDLTMALGLIEEGDVWRCADEGYVEVTKGTWSTPGSWRPGRASLHGVAPHTRACSPQGCWRRTEIDQECQSQSEQTKYTD